MVMVWEVMETHQEAGESCEEAEVLALGVTLRASSAPSLPLRLAHLVDFLSALRDRGQTQRKGVEWAEVPWGSRGACPCSISFLVCAARGPQGETS